MSLEDQELFVQLDARTTDITVAGGAVTFSPVFTSTGSTFWGSEGSDHVIRKNLELLVAPRAVVTDAAVTVLAV